MNQRPLTFRHLARIARVPDANHTRFLRLVDYAVTSARKESSRPIGKNISAGALSKDFFSPVARAAKRLRTELERLQGDNLAAGEVARSMAASHFFGEALRPSLQPEDHEDPIAHLLRSLDLGLVVEVAEGATERAKNWLPKSCRKKGTGNAAFEMFVMALLEAAEQNGGKLTIYKTAYEEDPWAGTLLKAVQHLRPQLPIANFYPAGKLGYSLHTIYRRWRSEAGKSRRKKH